MELPFFLQNNRLKILQITERYGARNVRIFGSMARGESKPASDVDFLVDMESDRSLLDLAGLKVELEELLQRKVDVITETSLYWLLRRKILKEAKPF